MEKKAVLKDIIRALHAGLPPAAAADRVLKEAGFITTAEIAAIEQELLDEGIDPAEIQKFCNVHALIFEQAIKPGDGSQRAALVIDFFKAENGLIRERIDRFTACLDRKDWPGAVKTLSSFEAVIRHYAKKEQILFPFLEKRGFTGPSKIMWGKHDDIRRLLKDARESIARLSGTDYPTVLKNDIIGPLLAEITGMIEKEELILYPAALEKLSSADLEAARQAFIEMEQEMIAKKQTTAGAGVLAATRSSSGLSSEPARSTETAMAFPAAPGEIHLPSGSLSLAELTRILNVLPVDLSFVDVHDEVKYFSETAERIFPRPRSVIGRNVKNCHPPKSLAAVERILNAFKDGRKDSVDFWINLDGKMVLIRYIAIRDEHRHYLGTLEVTQNITDLRALQGEKRLTDENDV